MGNACSGEDQFNGETYGRMLSPNQEVFVMGQIPIVNQDPKYFNDDEAIDSLPNGPIRYSQAMVKAPITERIQYNLKENTHIKVAAQALNNNQNLALVVSILTNEMQYRKPDGSLCPRQGIDIICLIDHSGSMAGEKEQIVRRTLKYMLQFLQSNDRLCLIMFDCQVYRLTRLMCITPANLEKFRIAIHSIRAQGGTDIGNAMKMALSVLKHRRYRNPVTAILLLSDGEDDEAPERVRSDLQTYNIREPFTIKTFGFGRDVCPRTMNEIAHMKEGQFYFVPNLQVIDECFVEALGGLVSVVANNMYLQVNPSQGNVQLKRAYGDKWQYDQWKGQYTLYQPHLLCGIKKDYVFEISMPQNPNAISAMHIRLQLDPLDGSPQVIIEETVQLTAAKEDTEALENYYRVKGAECFDQAYQLAEQGQFKQAQNLLGQMQQQIQLQHFHDPMMAMLENDLQTAGKQCYPGQYETGGKHNLTQLHVVHMYQKSRGVQVMAYQNGQPVEIPCSYQNNIQNDFKMQARKDKLEQPNQFQSGYQQPQQKPQPYQQPQQPYQQQPYQQGQQLYQQPQQPQFNPQQPPYQPPQGPNNPNNQNY